MSKKLTDDERCSILVEFPIVPFAPDDFTILFCPRCRIRTFHEMRALYREVGYWCSSCGLRARHSELNGLIDEYLGASKIIKIDMTARTSGLSAWFKRLQGWFWN